MGNIDLTLYSNIFREYVESAFVMDYPFSSNSKIVAIEIDDVENWQPDWPKHSNCIGFYLLEGDLLIPWSPFHMMKKDEDGGFHFAAFNIFPKQAFNFGYKAFYYEGYSFTDDENIPTYAHQLVIGKGDYQSWEKYLEEKGYNVMKGMNILSTKDRKFYTTPEEGCHIDMFSLNKWQRDRLIEYIGGKEIGFGPF